MRLQFHVYREIECHIEHAECLGEVCVLRHERLAQRKFALFFTPTYTNSETFPAMKSCKWQLGAVITDDRPRCSTMMCIIVIRVLPSSQRGVEKASWYYLHATKCFLYFSKTSTITGATNVL